MKGKMKKIIAAVATLAMAAQFAFVLPASAATTLPYTVDYTGAKITFDGDNIATNTTGWVPSDALKTGLSVQNDTTHGDYIQYVGSGSGSRCAQSAIPIDLTGKLAYVVEFDMALTASSQNGGVDFGVVTGTSLPSHVNWEGVGDNYLVKFSVPIGGGSMTLNDIAATKTTDVTDSAWYHYTLIVNTETELVTVTASDGTSTPIDKALVPIMGDKTKKFSIAGVHGLFGRGGGAIKFDNFTVREKTDSDIEAEREEEILSSVELTSQLNKKIIQTAGGAAQHFPITVKATGNYGNDLSSKATYEWSVVGLSEEDGYISLTAAEGTGAGTEGAAPGSTASTAYFNVRDGVSNWYGTVNVTISYLDEVRTLSTPFAVIGASGGGDNLAPAAGYPEEYSKYSDDLVGFEAYGTPSVVLANWFMTGSDGSRKIVLSKDEDGTKYLHFAKGTSGSHVPTYNLSNQTEQYILTMDVRFLGNESFGHYERTPNNKGPNASWSCAYTSGSLTMNGVDVATGMNNNEWYRIIVSADESTNKGWAKVYTKDGALLGESETISLNMANAQDRNGNDLSPTTPAYKQGQTAFCFGDTNVDLASFRIYKPSAATVTVTGADSISVPGYDEKALRGKGLEDSTLYTYDATAHTLTVNAADIDAAKLIIANYDKKKLTSFDIKDLTFTSGSTVVSDFTLPDSCRLMLWKPELEAIEPLKPVEGTGVSNPNLPALTPATAELNAIAETSEGFEITGDVNWTSDSEDANITLTPDKDDSHKATLAVKDGAPAGTVTVTASSGAASGTHEVGLTTSGNSIATTATATSLTIPFTGEEAVDATFTAKTVDKDGHDVEFAVDEDGEPTTTPATVTWSVLDKNLRDITANMPAGVTWDATNHKITVTDQAKATVIYVQAKNNDATPLSRNIKVNIHGMSFAFGTGEPEEGFTQVTAADAYTEKLGYGFLDASVVTNATANVTGSADYRFKVKVPNGNYVVKVTTSSASITSEVVENVAATTGIGKSGSQFNVAVADGVLDLTFASASTLSSLEIEQAAAKTAGEKPSIYAIGDSTTNNTGNGALSWGNYFSNNSATLLAGTSFGSFSNNGMAGRDSVNFYNQGRVESVLLAVRPGDYVTINMGINSKETGEGASYETLLRTYYIDAVAQRGAIPVIVTATPDGPVGSSEAADYNSTTGMFTNNRGDGARNNVLRALANEKGYNLIELGQAGEDWLNESTLDELKAYGGDQTAATKLALVQSWYVDHNHYKEPMGKWISEYMIKVLDEIAKGSRAYEAATD